MLRISGFCLLFLLLAGPPLPAVEIAPSSLAEKTIQRYRQALTVDPDNLSLHYYLGVSLLIEGRDRDAITEFRSAYPGFSDSVEANYNFALAHTRLGDADSALLYLERAEDLGAAKQPDLFPLTNLYFNLALIYIDTDQPADAIRLLHRIITRAENTTEARRLLGDLYLGQGQPDKAAEQWQNVLKEQPDDNIARTALYSIRFNKGLKALGTKQPDAARQFFLQARKLEPDSALCGYYLGYLAYQRQDYPAAIDLLTRSAATIPDDMQSSLTAMVYNSAAALLDAGEPEKARPAADFLGRSPDTETQAHYLTGNIHLALKQYPQAREQYLQVLEHDPTHVGANLNLQKADQGASETYFQQGRALYRQGNLPEAIRKLEAALRINPGHGMARSYLDQSRQDLQKESSRRFAAGQEALQAGHPRQALETIRQGLNLTPANEAGLKLEQQALAALDKQIRTLLADAASLKQAGSDREAGDIYRQVLQLEPDNTAARRGMADLEQQRKIEVDNLIDKGERALEDGRLSEARRVYRQALTISPQNRTANAGLERTEALVSSLVSEELHWARRARQAGQFSVAHRHYRKALQLKPNPQLKAELAEMKKTADRKVGKLLKAAHAASEAGQLNKARTLLAKAEAVAPNDRTIADRRRELETDIALRVRRNLATASAQNLAGQYQAALTSYRRVLDLDPGNPQAVSGLKQSRKALAGQLRELVAKATRAIDQGDYMTAARALEKARGIDPYDTAAGKQLQRLKTIRKEGLEPEDAQQLYLEGIELYTSGHYRDAITRWQQVLTLQPQHEKARLNIEKAERKLAQLKAFSNG
ncbi:hypothetical protein C2E25_13150 [Geothermobacter hydrogeniphilus]|uniref:Tetratricopeptide repeat protein n=1 Tax=Geothermobacter hydrogeniphilus TaxID=1969733 RepID=A0A2K2H7J9_9BACT|nr:tetratricopeptide repeat protein [Geothermobacter hydrogeniphilus]PNU19285.1 hypothetical protein C2E25_13150 [Geothermobacter hydrogeniphilus]